MSIAQQSLALSAGREDEGKKKNAYKTKIHSIRGEWRKIQTMGGNKNKQEQNAMFHKKKWTFELTFNAIVMIVIYIVLFFLVMSVRVAEGQWGGGLWVKRCPWCSG